ncbi:amino acid adenylation domain-containing protein, partial [Pseudomonas sp. No.117]
MLVQPAAAALVVGEREYRYEELNERANRLAHFLREQGVGPEILVGIALERDVEMVVGLLAILKAGGGYVPLDPAYPEERQAYMLEDSQARLVLTQRSLLARLPATARARAVVVDELSLADYPERNPARLAGLDNLAYSIYTSGSTGRPKGVLISHRNVAALIGWTRTAYDSHDLDGVLAATSICFDLSVWELFVTLACGGRVILADNALELQRLPARNQVSLINTVPSAIRALVDAELLPSSVRIVNLAGEPLPQALVERLYELPHIKRVHDLYGPSEDTTYSTHALRRPGGTANIGLPLANSAVHLVDAEGSAVGIGISGELCLAGAGLARGYLGRPALTAERFLPDPYAPEGGARLYRTGDLARRRPDGVLEYLGRIDQQVKVRGFRIELGEIEARLREHPTLREATVTVTDSLHGQHLVAYVVPAADWPLSKAAEDDVRASLKAALATRLPDYMVPAIWVFLAALPLTPNGKLDRRALPVPTMADDSREYVAPTTTVEQRLATIWAEVLKLERVGRGDNFFELGGDSIISLQVVARARQAGIRFTAKDLFRHQTIQGVAAVASLHAQDTDERGPVVGSVPLTPIQHWFFEQEIPARHHWNQSVLLETRSRLDPRILGEALQTLSEHHDALRTRFVLDDQGWQASVAPPAPEDQLRVLGFADPAAFECVADELQRSLDLGAGPLLRALLAEFPDGSQRLLLVIHHLVVDGVSWRILLEDLQASYAALVAGQRPQLPAKSSAFQAWAQRLIEYARSAEVQRELPFWEAGRQCAAQRLPCDRPLGSQRQKNAQQVSTRLSSEQTRRLLQDAPGAYRTEINDLLLTALARVLCAWSGHEQLLVRLEGHGREELFDDLDLTRTVGWFTSLYPVLLTPETGRAQSIKAIKEQLRRLPRKGIGYGLLRYLGDAETRQRLAAVPQGDVIFNYLGQFDASFADHEGLFVPAREGGGAALGEEAPLGALLSIDGRVYDSVLTLDWTFSREVFDEARIQALADAYGRELQALIDHCCEATLQGATPSDFPLARLEQPELDALALPLADVADLYPLSPMQQGMLFHSLYDGQRGDYVNQLCVDVEGLDNARFQRAWLETLAAHELLRARVIDGPHDALLLIRKQALLPYDIQDWRERPDQARALAAYAEADRQRGFELAKEPLLRIAVIRTAARRQRLIFTHHHLLMDGWSASRLFGEVLERYAGHRPATLAGGYRDYIAWLEQQDAAATQRFWQERTAVLDAPTRLVQALGDQAVSGAGLGRYCQLFSADHTHRLERFARHQRVTLNTLMQAAWLLLLRRYTGQEAVCFGATVSGRSLELPDIEHQIGLFINTLPVIGRPCADQTVASWLNEVQALNLALREHEHTPLYEIQRWAGQGGEPFFDSLLVFENYPLSEALEQGASDDLRFGELESREQTHYPLTLAVNLGEQLMVQYSYDGGRLDEA